jgi:hypothetical protein
MSSDSPSSHEPEEFVIQIVIERSMVKVKSFHSAIQIAEEFKTMLNSSSHNTNQGGSAKLLVSCLTSKDVLCLLLMPAISAFH